MGQRVLCNLSSAKAQNDGCRGLRLRIKINVVKSEKYDHRGERSPLIAVNKRMIACNTKSIGGREDGWIGFAISELIDRSRQCGFKKSNIADTVGAAEKSKLLGVEIKNDANVEPFRLIHFASALYVSAYLRNDRRAICIALACLGS